MRHRQKGWVSDFIAPGATNFDSYWTPELVNERLIEAVRLVQRTAGRVGPASYGSTMPSYVYDWGDKLAQVETQELGKGRNRVVLGATAAQVSLMERAIWWPAQYVAEHEGLLRVLRTYLKAKALRLPFDRLCKEKGWSRATAYRQRDRSLAIIAMGLNRDAVPVE